MKIHPPKQEDLVSVDNIKQYYAEVDTELDSANNALKYLAGARGHIARGEEIEGLPLIGVQVLAKKMHPYSELEKAIGIGTEWQRVRSELSNINKDEKAPPVTKATAHRVMDAAFHCFDENPENSKATHFRDLLQHAAKILGLEPLGKATALTAVAQQWVNPPIAIS